MYKESDLDKRNKKWFDNDATRNSLKSLTVKGCNLRGIFPSTIYFKYPITAIAGKNGCGKSTLLSMVACAFHNDSTFQPYSKPAPATNYYTYGDFFVFAKDERGLVQSINIESEYLTIKSSTDNTATIKKDTRKKDVNGKWNHYQTRPKRIVSFIGINRILPPSEDPTYKAYKNLFTTQCLSEAQKTELRGYVSTVMGRQYTDIDLYAHHKYKLFSVKTGVRYTGFNMGAGENAVLALIHEIMVAGEGALIVVDEIELGLHVKAQIRLIQVLKELCQKYKTQIICSTHSANILNELPPYARVLIQSSTTKTEYIYDVSADFAFSTMSGKKKSELSVFVEDDKAKMFIEAICSKDIRHRVEINIIGSADNSIPQQMIAHFRENKDSFCVIMDGDKRENKAKTVKKNVDALADNHRMSPDEKEQYFGNRMFYIPGTVNPERYLLEELLKQNSIDNMFPQWGYDDETLRTFIQQGIDAGTHNEFYTLSDLLALNEIAIYHAVVNEYIKEHAKEVNDICNFIRERLNHV